jgi:hypothetical protein
MLPPVGWADVATKEYVDLRLEVTENRLMAAMHIELRKQLWGIIGGLWVSVLVSILAAVVLDHVLG